MTITLNPEIEARFRAHAAAAGLSIDAYVERLIDADQSAIDELESLALEGLDSGEPLQPGPDYWERKHRRLDESLRMIDANSRQAESR